MSRGSEYQDILGAAWCFPGTASVRLVGILRSNKSLSRPRRLLMPRIPAQSGLHARKLRPCDVKYSENVRSRHTCDRKSSFILLFFILFYFILLYFTLLYFILLYFTLFCFILLCFILLCFILFYFILLYFTFLFFLRATTYRDTFLKEE